MIVQLNDIKAWFDFNPQTNQTLCKEQLSCSWHRWTDNNSIYLNNTPACTQTHHLRESSSVWTRLINDLNTHFFCANASPLSPHLFPGNQQLTLLVTGSRATPHCTNAWMKEQLAWRGGKRARYQMERRRLETGSVLDAQRWKIKPPEGRECCCSGLLPAQAQGLLASATRFKTPSVQFWAQGKNDHVHHVC